MNEINLLKENTQIDQTNGISLQKPHLTPEMDKTQCWWQWGKDVLNSVSVGK